MIRVQPGFRGRRLRRILLAAFLTASTPLPALAGPATGPEWIGEHIAGKAGNDLRGFYTARGLRPLWLRPDGQPGAAAYVLLDLIATASDDTLDPRKLTVRALTSALRRAERDSSQKNLAGAEIALSRSFVNYVNRLGEASRAPMIYENAALAPAVPSALAILQNAASAKSLDEYVQSMGWMHPLYAPLRRQLQTSVADPVTRAIIAANLQRIRALPAHPAGRHVIVETASARMWMYENGQIVDSMKVVVGKPDQQTPVMAGFLRRAIVNPYWNVPPDLVSSRIALNVLDKGVGYLASRDYQVLSDWSDNPRVVNPATIDWRAVAGGTRLVRVRQLPGKENFMGKVKFEFPNDLGIYLHDTPDKELMLQDARQLSSGCVRLEDAQRFGRWLLRKPLPRINRRAEQRVDLAHGVPIYIIYLTATLDRGHLALHTDPYGRDASLRPFNRERSR